MRGLVDAVSQRKSLAAEMNGVCIFVVVMWRVEEESAGSVYDVGTCRLIYDLHKAPLSLSTPWGGSPGFYG